MRDALSWLRAQWDRVTGTALIAVGAVVLVVTFQSVANSRFVADQIATVTSGGLGALFLVAVGMMLRLEGDLHDEWRKLDRIEAALRDEALLDIETLDAPAHDDRGRALPAATVHLDDTPAAPEPAPLHHVRGATAIPVLGLMASLAIIAAGYQKAANSADVDRAVTGLAVGVAGLGLAALVGAATLLVGRGRLAGRKQCLLGGWLRPAEPVAVGVGAAAAPLPTAATVVWVGAEMTRFHRGGCPTLAHGSFRSIPRAELPVGLRPCQICGAR